MMKEESKPDLLGDFVTEPELQGVFGISKSALAALRHNEGLPWCKVNQRSRLYYEPAVRKWLLDRQKVPIRITQDESDTPNTDSE